jgi:hypothetical protein
MKTTCDECSTCVFSHWPQDAKRPLAGDVVGSCRRKPPTALTVPGQSPITQQVGLRTVAIWPPVLPSDWCGEWNSREMYEIERHILTPLGAPEVKEP